MKIDFSDLKRNIATDVALTEQQLLDYAQKTTFDVQRDLILATPVKDGTARRGWHATAPAKPFDEGVVENQVAYIGKLNDGSSYQAPPNFVENVVERYSSNGGA